MRNGILTFAVVLALVTGCAGLAFAAGNGGVQPNASKRIQLAYHTNDTGAQEWVDWLTSKGFIAYRFLVSEASSVDFNSDNLIIIGQDTTSTDWSNSADLFGIKHSNLPVLGIGNGGYAYFHKTGAGFDNHFMGDKNRTDLYALDPANPIFNLPNAISIPGDKNITVHSSNVWAEMLYIHNKAANDTVLANDSVDMRYAEIANESSNTANDYIMWGFHTDTPNQLTSDGQKLLENVIWFSLGGYPVPEFDGSAYAITGFAGIMGAVAAVAFVARRNRD